MTATLMQAAALWIWHIPALFDLALAHEGWHIAQHLSFFSRGDGGDMAWAFQRYACS